MDPIQSIAILHRNNPNDGTTGVSPQNGLCIDTCQRQIRIIDRSQLDLIGQEDLQNWSVHLGWDAYWLMLRITSGLESQVLGETDVFGQVKSSWKAFAENTQISFPAKRSIISFFQILFQDTKEIRSRYLQGLGGSSYGTLARKILFPSTAPILIVGSGNIAASILPYLLDAEVWMTNRSEKRLSELVFHLEKKYASKFPKIRPIFPLPVEKETELYSQVGSIVFCTPLDSASDQLRVKTLRELEDKVQTLHLGATRKQTGEWEQLEKFFHLDDLFELQSNQNKIRSMQIAQAREACLDKTRNRSLLGLNWKPTKTLQNFCRLA